MPRVTSCSGGEATPTPTPIPNPNPNPNPNPKQATSGLEAAKKRLFCARGCGRALRLLFEMFLRCSAARPRNASGNIISESEPIYKLFAPTNNLFQLPVFSNAAYLEFAGRIAAAEANELAGREEPSAGSLGGLSPTTAKLEGVLARKMAPMEAKMDTMHAMLKRFDECVPATAVGPQDPPTESGGAKRKSVHVHAAEAAAKRGAAGIPIYVLSTEKTTVAEMWMEYTSGINGGPAVRDLVRVHGIKWRTYKGGKHTWSRHKFALLVEP